MAHDGAIDGTADGDSRDSYLAVFAYAFAASVRVIIVPHDLLRGTYYATWINGVWQPPNLQAKESGNIEALFTVDPGTEIGSIWVEQVGVAEIFDPYFIPSEFAEAEDALSAPNLRVRWGDRFSNGVPAYKLTPVFGDAQLSSISVSGARRGINVGPVPDFSTRGRLYYSIDGLVINDHTGADDEGGDGGTSSTPNNFNTFVIPRTFAVVGNAVDFYIGQRVRAFRAADHGGFYFEGPVTAIAGSSVTITPDDANHSGSVFTNYTDWVLVTRTHKNYFVRFWAGGGQLVAASGQILKSEAIVCEVENDSGLSVNCVLAYTGDVPKGDAYFDLRWPAQYQIHYSQAALVYPRQPQETVDDNGADAYFYLSRILASGNWNYNILTVDDDGNVDAAPDVPADSPVLIKAPPKSPQITSVTAAVVAGVTTLTAHFTPGESGCTFKGYRGDVNGPINFGQRTTPAPAGPTAVDATSIALSSFTYTPIDNTADYATAVAAIDAIAAALNTAFVAGEVGFLAALNTQAAAAAAAIAAFATAIQKRLQPLIDRHDAAYQTFRGTVGFANDLGFSTEDWTRNLTPAYGQYLAALSELLDGHPSHYLLPDGSIPGTRPDGSTGEIDLAADNLFSVAQPFVKPGIVYVAARATKGGVEEHGDVVFPVELQTSGAVELQRPNKADIQSIDLHGLTATIVAGVVEIDAAVTATAVDLMVDGVAVATVALPATGNGYHEVTFTYIFASADWYRIGARAKAASGAVSEFDSVKDSEEQYIGGNVADTVPGINAAAIRGKGA